MKPLLRQPSSFRGRCSTPVAAPGWAMLLLSMVCCDGCEPLPSFTSRPPAASKHLARSHLDVYLPGALPHSMRVVRASVSQAGASGAALKVVAETEDKRDWLNGVTLSMMVHHYVPGKLALLYSKSTCDIRYQDGVQSAAALTVVDASLAWVSEQDGAALVEFDVTCAKRALQTTGHTPHIPLLEGEVRFSGAVLLPTLE